MTLDRNGQFKPLAKRFLPLALTLTVVLFTFAPSHLMGVFFINPPLPLILMYCWAINYCDDFSYGSVFTVGLVTDILDSTLFGMHTFSYLIFFYLSVENRKYMAWKSFRFVWTGFAMFSFASMVIEWLISSINAGTLLYFSPLMFSWFMLVLLYPAVFWAASVFYARAVGDYKP